MSTEKPKFGPETFEAGEVIIQQGDIPDKFYIIVKGDVDVIDEPPDGLDVVIDQLGTGDYFGEVGLVKGSRRMATVRAATPVEVMTMNRTAFQNWLKSSEIVQQEIEAVIEQRVPDLTRLELISKTAEPTEETAENARLFTPHPFLPPGSQSNIRDFAPGEFIIRQGDLPDNFYIIVEGIVEVFHIMPDGQKLHVNHLTGGSYFGEIGLLDSSPRTASVQALGAVKVMAFDRETFRRWLSRSPGSQEEIEDTADRRRKDTGMLTAPPDPLPSK